MIGLLSQNRQRQVNIQLKNLIPMNQQPDKLFREKLENFHKPVSATAWSRVEKNITKKNDRTLWLKVAASIVLVATATVLLWPTSVNENQTAHQPNQKDNNKVVNPTTEQSKIPEPVATVEEKTAAQNIPHSSMEKKTIAKSRKQKAKSKGREENMSKRLPDLAHVQVTLVEELPSLTEVAKTEVPNETEISLAQNTVKQDDGITLIYTAQEVDEKYLDKKALAEATSADKKPSTLRKLLDKAYDLKHNQDPFGDLRQKKNEILALNFKNEKQRSQNK
jgi:hypothetical protein